MKLFVYIFLHIEFISIAENMCMLNIKMLFNIPNVLADHKLLCFNLLFTYIFEAV